MTRAPLYIAFPLHVGLDRLVATARYPDHVKQMIEELLFTNPGERVNRPDFGVGILELVFGSNSEEIAAATQFVIRGALQRWLSEHIRVDGVSVDPVDSQLRITVQYTLLRTGQPETAMFVRAPVP